MVRSIRYAMTAGLCPALVLALPLLASPHAHAQPTSVGDHTTTTDPDASEELIDAPADEVIELVGAAPAESASSVHFDARDLARRPHHQPSDLLRQTPGLVVAQHAGGGKSDQYFLRGFDADHGTDVAIFVDDVPVNLTSHGHGQGYADTHWLIPETVERIDVHKGPYAARFGDFYTAGAIDMRTRDVAPDTAAWLTTGAELAGPVAGERRPSLRLVGMGSPSLARGRALVAAEISDSDGPFLAPQDFRRGLAMAKVRRAVGDGEVRAAATFYAGRWNQSGQVPSAEVAAGRLDRFGAVDPTEGGSSSRASLALGYARGEPATGAWDVHAYAVDYRFRLFSNFTLYLRDPVMGDQIEQADLRQLAGIDASYRRVHRLGSMPGLLRVGVSGQHDDVTTELWHTAKRDRLGDCFDNPNPCNLTDQRIDRLSAYAEEDLSVGARVRILAGLRVDRFAWAVDDRDPETAGTMATNAGATEKVIASPKLSAIVRASDRVEVFVNAGLGFHSNDARAAVAADGEGALARAWGAEVGARATPAPSLRASIDLWSLYLSSEQVWSGDAGGTEPSDPTRRWGVDVELAWAATPWLDLDANLALARSTLVANAGDGGALALAPRLMGGAGLTAHRGPSTAALRLRGVGDRPADDAGALTAEGYLLTDLIVGHRRGDWMFGVTVENLLDTDWREAQFAESSRVSPDAVAREDVHFTPGAPRTALVTVGRAL